MKKIVSLLLICILALGLFAGCGQADNNPSATDSPAPSPSPETTLTPEARTELYTSAITTSRDAELNEYYPILTSAADDGAEFTLEVLGLTAADMTAFAASVSLMNVQAYAIVAVMPAEGKTDAVKEALNAYIENQQAAFEQYLPEPYENACNAKLETLSDGTVLLVMCENQDDVFAAVSTAITAE